MKAWPVLLLFVVVAGFFGRVWIKEEVAIESGFYGWDSLFTAPQI